ncbi:hypothetical protein MHYP_G00014830 [Metynnis hypsauchen]
MMCVKGRTGLVTFRVRGYSRTFLRPKSHQIRPGRGRGRKVCSGCVSRVSLVLPACRSSGYTLPAHCLGTCAELNSTLSFVEALLD